MSWQCNNVDKQILKETARKFYDMKLVAELKILKKSSISCLNFEIIKLSTLSHYFKLAQKYY